MTININDDYKRLLIAISRLSGLFSDNSIPYINYRVVENIFCKTNNAINLSRSDTAFDAKINTLGIGLKTFICENTSKLEKVAEFNVYSQIINNQFDDRLKIEKISELRNDRILLAKRVYNIDNAIYHIVARKENQLVIFDNSYDTINLNEIRNIKNTSKSISFNDNLNEYSYNYSKSTLFKRFTIPSNATFIPVEIIDDPYSLLLGLSEIENLHTRTQRMVKGFNYVILPLYSKRNSEKYVPERSGLNQWNANGRKRDSGEMYIPIPRSVHTRFPEFFPNRDTVFKLKIPTGEIFNAKVCQDNGKALMTNPNNSLSNWLLRKVLSLNEYELATIDKFNRLGFDSVIISKDNERNYTIDISKSNSFENF